MIFLLMAYHVQFKHESAEKNSPCFVLFLFYENLREIARKIIKEVGTCRYIPDTGNV